MLNAQAVKEKAFAMGFNLVGIAPAAPSPRLDAYFQWIESGMHGEMGYMAREDRKVRRRDLNVIVPGAQSIIIVGLDYHALNIPGATVDTLTEPSRARIAAYAWGSDYHDVMAPRLEALAEWMREQCGAALSHRVYVDTGAVLERSHAQQAGIGFVGKNTMLIDPKRGSYFFLGEIITDAAFDQYDPAHRETMCGSCMRCQFACPTNAFPKPYVLDARRCISYLTIEHKGWIDRDLRPLLGNWVYGCDVCQDVCPFSRFVVPTRESLFLPTSLDRAAPPVLELLRMDNAAFKQHFAGAPIVRIGRDRMVRNACIVAGNWANKAAIEPLIDLLTDQNPLVRGHAAWALGRIKSANGKPALVSALAVEVDPDVQCEIQLAIKDVCNG